MGFHAAGANGGCGCGVGDVDQGTGFVLADLVKEDGGAVAEDYMAVFGKREWHVDELEAPKFGFCCRFVL